MVALNDSVEMMIFRQDDDINSEVSLFHNAGATKSREKKFETQEKYSLGKATAKQKKTDSKVLEEDGGVELRHVGMLNCVK